METKPVQSLKSISTNCGTQQESCQPFSDIPNQALIAQLIRTYKDGQNPSVSIDCRTVKESDIQSEDLITVVTRTQGKRMDLLEETLLCLSAQTEHDFQFLIVGHKLDESAEDAIQQCIADLPEWLRTKTSFVETDEGGRAHPLNVGFAMVRTKYAIILDDDDLIFDNWIEVFKEGIRAHEGQIIHSGVYTQEWERAQNRYCQYVRAVESPLPQYCQEFDYLDQLNANYCPTMGLAFPIFVFQQLGMRFDESLDMLEDWDFLMRAACICGVFDTGRNTAIYRLWSNTDNSHALHSEREWEACRQRVQAKINENPYLFPSGYYLKIARKTCIDQDVAFDISSMRVFTGNSAGETKQITSLAHKYDAEEQRNTVSFSLGGSSINLITLFFLERGQMTLSGFTIELRTVQDEIKTYDMFDLRGTYYCLSNDRMGFIVENPFVELKLPQDIEIDSCSVTFAFRNYAENNLLTGTKLVLRLKRKIKRLLRKLKGKIG